MKRIHFSVGPTVQISSVHRLRRPFHTWPVPHAGLSVCFVWH
jgi:hypothetical protein